MGMKKKLKTKFYTIFTIAVFLVLNSANLVFAKKNAMPDTVVPSKYPDYAYEFTGKDKFEKFNRKLFIFDLKLNKYAIKPFNTIWCTIFPKYAMDRFSNFYTNMNFPVRAVSCAVQKDYKSSRREVGRFFINLTVGIAGFYDPAASVFKLKPTNEDMEQALAFRNTKRGPYLVLPVVRGTIRDLEGQLLDCPLRPFSYIPFAGGAVNAVLAMNKLAYQQPIIKKVEETYADPYEVTRQIDGLTMYIKTKNLDRDEIFNKTVEGQKITPVNYNLAVSKIKPDVELLGFNPQTPIIDAMRTVLFDWQYPEKSHWAELSVWNRNFDKKIKTSSVNIESKHPDYKYRYILQKNKKAPLAIIYPSIGERITDGHSKTLTRMLYNNGYSVIIQGSSFQWEFVQSMPDDYRPGLPYQDAKYIRLTTAKIIKDLEKKKHRKFDKKIIIGSSFGAMTTLFVAAQEEKENTLGITKYIVLNPPIQLLYALKQCDKFSQDWKNDSSDIKMRAAIAAEKTINYAMKYSNKNNQNNNNPLPFTESEVKLLIGFVMKQKLSDVVFTIEKNSRSKKCPVYNSIRNMSVYDYGEKYLFVNQNKTMEQLDYDTSLSAIADYLRKNNNYKIYHAIDDYYTNQEQLSWLKQQTGKKSVFFSNGSHLGYLYRKEFFDSFMNDIKMPEAKPIGKL